MILGGARSGKSSYALKEASAIPGKKAFIATAEALDDEMRDRIEKHRKERGNDWYTFEEPVDIASLIERIKNEYDVVIVDCLTLWVSNIMLRGLPFTESADNLAEAVSDYTTGTLYIVSNEVGLGLVPESPIGRQYRDNIGYLNARMAGIATEVYFMAAGIPLKIKEKNIG